MRIPGVVREFSAILLSAGFECHLVGGAVRDILMRRPHTDFDIATNADPGQVRALYRRVIPTGIRHGTVTVLFRETTFEVTTYRTEAGYSDGRHPDAVRFAPRIEEDLSRRDFTINAMAWDMSADRMVDPHGGRKDLERRLIRAIGDPAARFREDGLRPLRACRIAAQLGFEVETETRGAIPGSLQILARVSAERVRDELVKTLESPVPSRGLFLMQETGILSVVLPELMEGVGITQGDLHCHDVLSHSLYACDAAPQDSLLLRFAALLHDVGKPRARGTDPDGRPTFYGHEKLSASMTEEILARLRLPNAFVRDVTHLVSHHMFNYQDEWTDAAVRRLIARVGEGFIGNLIELRRADQIGMCPENATVFPEGLARFSNRVTSVLGAARALTVTQLAVSGTDIMTRLSLSPGPMVGIILKELLQTVLDDPAMNDKEKLLGVAEKLHRERLKPGG
jgi:poly(A) polymerase/tRNA nucleotidyltransferase (CCA-adding enzyme)